MAPGLQGAVRARAAWQNLSLDLDYAVAPEDLVLGGDIEGLSQDFEAMVSYELPQRDVRVFAGRDSTGVRGINLPSGDSVISMAILNHVDASAEERETRGFISITTIRPSAGLTAH